MSRVLTLLGAPDCHLCHAMRGVVAAAIAGRDIELIERNVRDDPELLRRYRLEIPLLFLEGEEIARHRVTGAQLEAKLGRAGI